MNKKLNDYNFSKRASSYDEGVEGKVSKKFYSLLLRTMDISSGAIVLDVGCGTGALLNKISETFNVTGYGIDTELNMIAEAKKKCLKIDFQIARCDEIPFDENTFDIIISCLSFHHFDNRDGFIKEAARVLKQNGLLYIVEPRFPWLIRKAINGFFKFIHRVGHFYTSAEIESRFTKAEFISKGFVYDSYAQVIILQKG